MPSAMPSLWKKPVEKVVLNVATGLAKSRRSVVTVAGIDESKVEANRFVAAFCGTGTGHFTQTLAVIKILQKAGMTLAAVITVRRAPRPTAAHGRHSVRTHSRHFARGALAMRPCLTTRCRLRRTTRRARRCWTRPSRISASRSSSYRRSTSSIPCAAPRRCATGRGYCARLQSGTRPSTPRPTRSPRSSLARARACSSTSSSSLSRAGCSSARCRRACARCTSRRSSAWQACR